MIKNERQYRITRVQIDQLEQALIQVVSAPEGDSRLQFAEEESLRSQIVDLQLQVEQYEALLAGEYTVLILESFDELPQALIKARIAAGLSHKDLAERLGLKEQQIQRYESNDYASASLERLQEIIRALGVQIREEVILPKAKLSFERLMMRLERAGLSSDFVITRLIPRTLQARIEDPTDSSDPNTLILNIAAAIGRVFGWSPADLFGPGPLIPNASVIGITRYKTANRIDEKKTSAYTVYAHYLALLVLEATATLPKRSIPEDPHVFREAVVAVYGSLTFEHVLRYIWSLGVPVLPLKDSGAFHGACWRVDGRNVIVLKQSIHAPARWLFDLLHETKHVASNPDQLNYTHIEHNEFAKERVNSLDEQAASQYAGDILLHGRAEELTQYCVQAANNNLARFKQVIPQIAKREGVRQDALANYMAFRLSLQGENWWGAANNLQVKTPDPWVIARNVLLEYVNLSVLNEADRSVLLQALTESV